MKNKKIPRFEDMMTNTYLGPPSPKLAGQNLKDRKEKVEKSKRKKK